MAKTTASHRGDYSFGKLNLTEKRIQRFVSLWLEKTNNELAEEFDWSPAQVSYVAYKIRETGYPLPRKQQKAHWNMLIKRALGLPDEAKPKKKSK